MRIPLKVIEHSSQHVEMEIGGNNPFRLCVVYGANHSNERQQIYTQTVGKLNAGWPLAVMGDFNTISSTTEGSNQVRITSSMRDFSSWIYSNDLIEHPSTGTYFTWHKNQVEAPIARR